MASVRRRLPRPTDLARGTAVARGLVVVRDRDGALVLWALGRDRIARRFELARGDTPARAQEGSP